MIPTTDEAEERWTINSFILVKMENYTLADMN